jgi:RNA polymerase sigma factor (sigma-70 family)
MVSVALVQFMDDGHDLVVRTIREHAAALLRTARRESLCLDDAHDAYQRALEIFLRRAPSLDPEMAIRWLHVVVRNEARAVRAARLELVGADEANLDACRTDREPDADERAVQWDRLARSAEALQRLKPQEVTALWLKAQGLSYAEIAESQQWTYTKVNRCLVEGRRAFLRRYAGIEAGEECDRWAGVVSALVDGEATAEQLAAARPHLRRCASCRATVRELRGGGRGRGFAGVLPALPGMAGGLAGAGLAGAGGLAGAAGIVNGARAGGGRRDALVHAAATLHDRALGWALKLQGAAEAASGAKAATVAASAAVLVGGGAVTVHEVAHAPARPAALHARVSAANPGSANRRPPTATTALHTTSGPPAATSRASTTSGRAVSAPWTARGPEFGVDGEFSAVTAYGIPAFEFATAEPEAGRSAEFRTAPAGPPPTSEFAAPAPAPVIASPERAPASRERAPVHRRHARRSTLTRTSSTTTTTPVEAGPTPDSAPAGPVANEFAKSAGPNAVGGSASTRQEFPAGAATGEFGGG